MRSDLKWLSPFLIRLERRQQSNGLNDHPALFNDCACALAENLNYDPESFFPLRYMLVCIETSFMQMFALSFKERIK